MNIRYCLPIIKQKPAEILATIKTHTADYYFFEVWLDYIDNVSADFIEQLLDVVGDRLILLFRRQKLEDIHMSLANRKTILDMLNHSDALIDLDITTQPAELDYISQPGKKYRLITSYHNYRETPDAMQRTRIIATMAQYEPFMYKFATHCPDEQTALQLLHLLIELKDSGHVATVIGMGRHGQITRLYGTLWGNEITFAPNSLQDASAPGQLTRAQYEVLLKELGY